MTPTTTADPALTALAQRVERLEALVLQVVPGNGHLQLPSPETGACLPEAKSPTTQESLETPVAPWQYLVKRKHPWRWQLYIKGRRQTARQLVGGVVANKLTEEEAAANYHLPVEAIREAFAYFEQNRKLVEVECEIERLMLQRGGVARGPQALPG